MQTDVREAGRRRDPARGRALDEPAQQQERLVDVLDRLGRLADRDRERAEPDGPADERAAQRVEDRPVDLVEAELVDLEQRERVACDVGGDPAVGAHLGVVAHPLQQPVRDAGRSPGAARDLVGAVGLELDAEDRRDPAEDRGELVVRVVVEAGDEAEAVAQRPADRARCASSRPTSVKRGRSRRIVRALGPLPITTSNRKSSIAG